jgi:hemoglobin
VQTGRGISRLVPPRRPGPDQERRIQPHPHPHAHASVTEAGQDIATPADLTALLRAFYSAALLDGLLGPVFDRAGMRLETHLPRIGAFWEVTLLGTGDYTGTPLALHRQAAAVSGLGEAHFARWLLIWESTVTSMFTGPTASRAISEAQRMSVGMLRDIRSHPEEHQPTVRSVQALSVIAPVPATSQ